MFKNLLISTIALGGGVIAGGALAAFITLIKLIPRLIRLTETHAYIKVYESAFAAGGIVFTILYFSDSHLGLSNGISIIVAMGMGAFIGLFSSALAEVLNVVPVLSKKMKIVDELKYIIYALLFGRLLGSVYYWIYF